MSPRRAQQAPCRATLGCRGGAWLRWAGVSLLWLLALLGGGTAVAQDPDNDSLFVEEEEGGFQDTLETDTVKRKKVKEKTDWLDPVALMNGRPLRQDAEFRLDQVMYPDLIDRLPGFVASLGQWGKPYMRYRYGAEASNFDEGVYVSPITGAENVYFLDPQYGMRYYDTRTPYVNAYYAQGRADAAQLRVDISQNIHPLLNASLLYYRRQSNGVYSNFVTDHNTIGATSNFHTLNERYQVYGHFLLQEHIDEINGGVVPFSVDSSQFEKGNQPVVLQGANLVRFSRAGSLRQFYRLTKDTVGTRHRLSLYNGYFLEHLANQFIDHDVSAALNTGFYMVYPTVGDSSTFYERMVYVRRKADLGVTYSYRSANWKLAQRLELGQEFNVFTNNFVSTDVNHTTLLWKGSVVNDPNPREIEVNWTYRKTFNNLFRPETFTDVHLAWRFPKWQLDYSRRVPGPPLKPQDSTTVTRTHRPYALTMQIMSYGRNPTLQQALGVARPGNNMASISNLSNQRINHFNLGIEARGKSTWATVGEVPGNYFRLGVFTTTLKGQIFYGQQGWTRMPLEVSGVYSGAELKVRGHWKKLFLESETVFQGYYSQTKRIDTLFVDAQPHLYTKTSLFYENKDLKFASILRAGVDLWFFSYYQAPYFDPSAQTFYQQSDYYQIAYPRLDAFFATQIKRAHIYVKMVNLLENAPQAGYFTTMGYPMPVRQVMLGLNWTFFD